MSAAMFELLADPAKAIAMSAGTEPGIRVHPEVQHYVPVVCTVCRIAPYILQLCSAQ